MIRRRVTIFLLIILVLIQVFYAYRQTPEWGGSDFLPWAANILRYQIYWIIRELLVLALGLLERWIQINSPLMGLGGFLFMLLLLLNLLWILKGVNYRRKQSVYCQLDELPAKPIRGTIDRYRCPRGHQFTDEPHSHR